LVSIGDWQQTASDQARYPVLKQHPGQVNVHSITLLGTSFAVFHGDAQAAILLYFLQQEPVVISVSEDGAIHSIQVLLQNRAFEDLDFHAPRYGHVPAASRSTRSIWPFDLPLVCECR
jgi:hypothetical protein